MAWTTPITWNTNQLVSAANLNEQVRDNLSYLFAKPVASVLRTGTSDYSVNSSSFVDVDGTNLILTVNVTSGRVLLMMNATWGPSGNTAYLDWIVDGTTRLGGTSGLMAGAAQSNVCLIGLATGLSAGSHTFKPQWKSTGVIYLYNNGYPINLYAMEI